MTKGDSKKQKFYGVRTGHKPGVYTTYEDALEQVKGCKGAKHKSFSSRKEAQAFVNGSSPSYQAASSPRPGQSAPLKQVWSPEYESQLIEEGALICFADGSCAGNGQHAARAGSGVCWVNPKDALNVSERLPGKQTNQCAELYAMLRALEVDPDPERPLYIFSDSTYSIKCMNEWAKNWIRKDWKTSTGQEPENADLIKLVYAMADLRPAKVVFSWVKAHDAVGSNEAADQMAVRGNGLEAVPARNFVEDLDTFLREHRERKRAAQLAR